MKKRFLLISSFLFIAAAAQAQAWLWAKQSQVALKTELFTTNVATNKTGNVYQAGGYTTSVTFGAKTLISQAQEDIFLVKYDPNGTVLWAQTSKGTPNSFNLAYSVATDDSDNAYVEGYGVNAYQQTVDTISLGPFTLHLPYMGYSFLVKYNSNGKVVWATQPDTTIVPDDNYGWIVTTDKFGHEYVTGEGAYLLKYDRNGNLKWSVSNLSNFSYSAYFASAVAMGLSTDASGNIYMSGYFHDTLMLGNNILYSFYDAQFVAKFDSSGNVLWAQQTNDNAAFSNYEPYNSITVDGNNAAYLTGDYGDSIEFGNTLLTDVDSLASIFFVVKFNPSGSVAWVRQDTALYYNLYNGWTTYSISSDDSNHIYLIGAPAFYSGTLGASFIFANDTVSILDTDSHDAPVFMLKLDSTGHVLCSTSLAAGGSGNDAITADPSGQFVYIGGTFFEDFDIGNTLMTNTTGVYNSFISRWQSCYQCNLSVTIPSSPSICNGDSALLTVSGAASYTWAPPAGLSSTTGNSVLAAPTITTTYTVTYLDNGCGGSAQCVVTVEQPPNKPIITISVTGDTLHSSARNGNQWYVNGQAITGATDSFFVIKGLPVDDSIKVQVTDVANGCSNVSDVFITGINRLAVGNTQLSVYPNPTSSSVFIAINSVVLNINRWSLQVTNVLGQLCYSKASLTYSNEIDLSALPGGIYFIAVLSKTARTVVPVVKE